MESSESALDCEIRRQGFEVESAELCVGENEYIRFCGAQCLTLNVTENEIN